jgi:hypothetical protein
MNSPVTLSEILPAEIKLLSGVNFELLCFHPYKAVLAITEDLRTYLKSEKGRSLVNFATGSDRPIIGQDLKPMHDAAHSIVNDVIVSDIPLLYTRTDWFGSIDSSKRKAKRQRKYPADRSHGVFVASIRRCRHPSDEIFIARNRNKTAGVERRASWLCEL